MVQLLLVIIYMAFISLGLPDSLLGSAWPTMYVEFGVPVSSAGALSMLMAAGTVVSSLLSDRLIRRFGAAKVTAVSTVMTAVALFGFSISNAFWMLFLWAVPYGLGAGCVDAALNNYVALHYESRHMSWLHCMWGLGTIVGPYVMGYVLANGIGWPWGYRYVGMMQLVLALILFISMPLWRHVAKIRHADIETQQTTSRERLSYGALLRVDGVWDIMITLLCYCTIEQTAILWGSSYMVLHNGIAAETAASYASMLLIGITAGRALTGFLTYKFDDTQMVRMGAAIIGVGAVLMMLPMGNLVTFIGLVLIGLGCAPIYPCIIHSTPIRFGPDRSQAIIGLQMASAYVGTCVMSPIFGLIANYISVSLFPYYLVAALVIMVIVHEKLVNKTNIVQ